MEWKDQESTEKQRLAIHNMRTALDWITPIPATKGECSKLIGEMKAEIANRVAATGYIRPSIHQDQDEDGDMFDYNDSWD